MKYFVVHRRSSQNFIKKSIVVSSVFESPCSGADVKSLDSRTNLLKIIDKNREKNVIIVIPLLRIYGS